MVQYSFRDAVMTKYPWPVPPGASGTPVWTGKGFLLEGKDCPVLSYSPGSSGWTDELTSFCEDTAGATHPVECSSRRDAIEQLKQHVGGKTPVILEVGSSSGFMLKEIQKNLPYAHLIGSDYVGGPLRKLAANMPGVPLLQFDLAECPLPDESVDAIVSLHVLEHIPNDVRAVGHLYRILKPGGKAVIEVPAGPHLYDMYDRLMMHQRRYALSGLCSILHDVGFEIVRKSHLGCFVYPAFALLKRWHHRNGEKRNEKECEERVAKDLQGTAHSRMLELAMRAEAWLGKWISYPVGMRCLVTVEKPTVVRSREVGGDAMKAERATRWPHTGKQQRRVA